MVSVQIVAGGRCFTKDMEMTCYRESVCAKNVNWDSTKISKCYSGTNLLSMWVLRTTSKLASNYALDTDKNLSANQEATLLWCKNQPPERGQCKVIIMYYWVLCINTTAKNVHWLPEIIVKDKLILWKVSFSLDAVIWSTHDMIGPVQFHSS